MICAGCGCSAPEGAHSEYHFAGEKARRFWLCGDVCYWRAAMIRAREEAMAAG